MRDETKAFAEMQQKVAAEMKDAKKAAQKRWFDARFTVSRGHAQGNRHERRKRVVLLERRVRELKRRDAAKAFRQAAKDAKRVQSEGLQK